MKIHFSRQSLHQIVLFSLCLLSALVSPAQDCKTLAANKPSATVRAKDEVSSPTGKMSPTEMAKMKPYLVKAESWVKNILSGFTGAKLLYYNTYFPDFVKDGSTHDVLYKATGIKSYYSAEMMFFAYYCNDKNTLYTEDESGSNIEVVFNNVFTRSFTSDAGVHSINGKPVFRAIQKKRSEGKTDFYELMGHDNATGGNYISTDYIILRNSINPALTPVTRKAYLEQMIRDIDAAGIKDTRDFTESYDRNIKAFEEEMKTYKATNKTYTPEKEANRRKWFAEDQEKLKKLISKTSADAAASKDVVKQYLQGPSDRLSRGFRVFYSNSFTAKGVAEYLENLDKPVGPEETQYEIVSINPDYFNSKLSADVPQLIMVISQNSTYPHMQKAARLIKQPGALAPLQAILKTN